MTKFEEKKFNIKELKGISAKTIEEHLKLYSGYVKNSNLILSKIDELSKDEVGNAYTLGELQRRFGFEFGGMRNHEVYFDSLSDGAMSLADGDHLQKKIEEDFGSFDVWLARFKAVAMTRGVGWAVLYFDKQNKVLFNAWMDEQHIGQLSGLTPILMLDMWEHSFVADYQPSGKKQYVEDFFANLNWKKIEENLDKAV